MGQRWGGLQDIQIGRAHDSSPLSPYTTLSRAVCNYPLPWPTVWPAYVIYPPTRPPNRVWDSDGGGCKTFRSEEHTTHLPSLPTRRSPERYAITPCRGLLSGLPM